MTHSYPKRAKRGRPTWRSFLSSHLSNPQIEPTDEPPFGQGFTAFRTDITDPALKSSTARDPARWCVIHKLSHPLSKCRAFRTMPLTERKNVLSQYRTTNHVPKDCATQVKCYECHSDKHVTALHVGPPSKPAAEGIELKDAQQYGAEPAVTSSCTGVWKHNEASFAQRYVL